MNAFGEPFTDNRITEVVVGRYDESVNEIEQQFFDLEVIAEDLWRADVASRTNVALSSLRNAAGQPFPGIDGNGTWLVALVCGDCLRRAPWYITVLTPCPLGR